MTKKIHYCWFGGGPLPESVLSCIESWKKYCPDFEIIEWNESNFDVSFCDYSKEAYEAGKWAFASDVARMWILYTCGGLYLDTDVELIKGIDDIIEQGPFMAKEPFKPGRARIATGLGMYFESGDPFCKEILESYKTRHFRISENICNDETVVTYVTNIMKRYGFKGNDRIENVRGINIYPSEYFCPIDYRTRKMTMTDNTRAIHWYSETWKTEREREISRRIAEIHNRYPGDLGNIATFFYECTVKTIYYTKIEGIGNIERRIRKKFRR